MSVFLVAVIWKGKMAVEKSGIAKDVTEVCFRWFCSACICFLSGLVMMLISFV